MIINTGLLMSGLRSEFFNKFDSMDAAARYRAWATRVVSTKDSENYRWLGTVPQMREWGNGRLAKGLRSESYDVQNLKYESTLEVDRDEISDDQTGQIRVRVNELAERAATHKDYLIGQLLLNGATAGYNAYDGLPFFSDSHESGKSGVQSNNLTFGVTNASQPTTTELKEALKVVIGKLLGFKDDQGEPMHQAASGLVVVTSPTLYPTMLEAVNATVINNTTNVMAGIADVAGFPYLSAVHPFFVLKTDGTVRPFIFQDREPIEPSELAEGSEEEMKREKYLFGVRARYRMAYGYWQHAARCTLTD